MKKILFLALAAVLTSTACKDNTPNRFDGVIVDASMNTVTVKALTGDDTYTFSLDEADKTDANGLLIGNLISVSYLGKMSEITPATQVATDATYAKAIGKWTMPDPIDSTKRMGVRTANRRQGRFHQHGDAPYRIVGVAGRSRQGDPQRPKHRQRTDQRLYPNSHDRRERRQDIPEPRRNGDHVGKRKLSGCEPLVFPSPVFRRGFSVSAHPNGGPLAPKLLNRPRPSERPLSNRKRRATGQSATEAYYKATLPTPRRTEVPRPESTHSSSRFRPCLGSATGHGQRAAPSLWQD